MFSGTKLLPLLQGRGGVDFERREVAQLVKAGSLNLDPDGTTQEIHVWLRDSVSDWCKHFKDIAKDSNEKKRLRSLLLQDPSALESLGIWSFLDLVLPRIPSRPLPPTFSMDRARISLLRNKLQGISVKCCLANITEQIVASIQMKRPKEHEMKRAYVVLVHSHCVCVAKKKVVFEYHEQVRPIRSLVTFEGHQD